MYGRVWGPDQDAEIFFLQCAGRSSAVPPPPSSQTLLSVAIHSLNNEPGRTERIVGIESKFFVMEKNSIIAGAFIFTVEVSRGRPEVFSFILVLPHSEMQEYLTRFAFYEAKVHQLLQRFLIEPLIKVHEHILPLTLSHSFSLLSFSLTVSISIPPTLPPPPPSPLCLTLVKHS